MNQTKEMRESETEPDVQDPEAEILEKFRFNILEDRGESLDESTLLRDLKALKEDAWAKKQAKQLRKLKKVEFFEKSHSLFKRNCCKCSSRKLAQLPLEKVIEETKHDTITEQFKKEKVKPHQCDQNQNARSLAILHSIDMYGSIIPKEFLRS